jgi:hypothetical protein
VCASINTRAGVADSTVKRSVRRQVQAAAIERAHARASKFNAAPDAVGRTCSHCCRCCNGGFSSSGRSPAIIAAAAAASACLPCSSWSGGAESRGGAHGIEEFDVITQRHEDQHNGQGREERCRTLQGGRYTHDGQGQQYGLGRGADDDDDLRWRRQSRLNGVVQRNALVNCRGNVHVCAFACVRTSFQDLSSVR